MSDKTISNQLEPGGLISAEDWLRSRIFGAYPEGAEMEVACVTYADALLFGKRLGDELVPRRKEWKV